jgi:hypothetical protein
VSEDVAQTTTLSYTIGVAIALVLITGLLIGGSGFVADQGDAAVRAELEVLGQQVATDIEAADRLAVAADGDATVRLGRTVPQTVAGRTYTVELVADEDPFLRLTSSSPTIEVDVEFTNTTSVADTSIDGGPFVVNLTAANELAIEQGEPT